MGRGVNIRWRRVSPAEGHAHRYRHVLTPPVATAPGVHDRAILTLLANSLPRGDQRCKGGDVRFRGLGMGVPGHDAFQIDTDRHQHMLERGFGQTNLA